MTTSPQTAAAQAPTAEEWADLRERLENAERTLSAMSDEEYEKDRSPEGTRLAGKAEGISLALSYMRDYGKDAGR